MELEWDEAKRNWTLKTRSLDFADVALIDWDNALTLEDTRKKYSEKRFITYAALKGRFCVVAWCYRARRLRVISLRKANEREVKRYV